MGKTLKKKEKEQKKIRPKSTVRYMPITKKQIYTIYQLDFVIEDLKQNKKPDEFASAYGFSNRQVKIIRQIVKLGLQNDINIMYECKYTLISILNMIQLRRDSIKRVEKRKKKELKTWMKR